MANSTVSRPPETNSLMECSKCMRVVHPDCETDYGVEGIIRSVEHFMMMSRYNGILA